MKYLSVLLCVTALCGCASQGSVFSWYHPRGGPYLFNFDHNECQVEVAAEGMNPGADPDGPFFLCMQARGYSLVTAEVYSAEAELWAELVNNDS